MTTMATGKWKRRRGFRFRRGKYGTVVEYDNPISDELFNRRRAQELLVYENNLRRGRAR